MRALGFGIFSEDAFEDDFVPTTAGRETRGRFIPVPRVSLDWKRADVEGA